MGLLARRVFGKPISKLFQAVLCVVCFFLLLHSILYVALAPAEDNSDTDFVYHLPDNTDVKHNRLPEQQATFNDEEILEKLGGMEKQLDTFLEQQDVLVQVLKDMGDHLQKLGQVDPRDLKPRVDHMVDRIQELMRTSKALRRERVSRESKALLPAIQANPEDVKQVMILSYQRTGSTLLMDSLFNNDPEMYFISEPLDALYVSMYGVEPGWAVAQDISTNSDGTVRDLPQHEIEAITWLFEQIFTCNMTMTSLPLEIYLHHFWYWANPARPYMLCLNDHDIGERNVTSCRRQHIEKLCGSRFGLPEAQTDLCLNQLWGSFLQDLGKPADLPNKPFAVDESPFVPFRQYRDCVDRFSIRVEKCLPLFANPCISRGVRALKVVRPSMEALPALFDKFPNLRVIHSFRDPRGVVRSRRAAWWSPGLYEQASADRVSSTAKVYCDTVVSDYIKRKRLERRYKDRFLEVVYDEFVQNPFINTIKIYQFLNLPMAVETETFLKRMTEDKDPVKIAQQWKDELTREDIGKVQEACAHFAKVVGFDWNKWS